MFWPGVWLHPFPAVLSLTWSSPRPDPKPPKAPSRWCAITRTRGKHGKKRVISCEGGYHVSGQMAAALTGMSYCHDGFDVPPDMVVRVGRPHYLRDAAPGAAPLDAEF